MSTEEKLSPELLAKANKTGNEYAWKKEDIFNVIADAKEKNLQVVGGQVQFRLPNGTCELYELSYGSEPQHMWETWSEFVDRSARDVSEKLHKLIDSTDLRQVGIERFDVIKKLSEDSNSNIEDYLYFVLYVRSEISDDSVPVKKKRRNVLITIIALIAGRLMYDVLGIAFLVIVPSGIIGSIVAHYGVVKKNAYDKKWVQYVIWSNVITWCIPVLGILTGSFALQLAENIPANKTKFYVLGLVGSILGFAVMAWSLYQTTGVFWHADYI